MDRPINISDVDKVERIRQAVIALRYDVTVGDVVSATGLATFEVDRGLKSLLETHEGALRVSEHGELLFSFKRGFIERDQRSWWQRSRDGIYKGFKVAFKVCIMLTLVVYFVIYLSLLTAFFLITLTRKRFRMTTEHSGFGGMIWLFWGNSLSLPTSAHNGIPLYTRVYQFVFGAESEPIDPLADGSLLGQLIRSKNGIITADDWILVSNKRRELAEDDLAHYTAVFDGNAEIMEDGTLVYSFAKMMKSKAAHGAQPTPEPAWCRLEKRRPLSGNADGDNGMVIGLNLFNVVMALVMWGVISFLDYDPQMVQSHDIHQSYQHYLMLLVYFPLAFTTTLFVIPLFRLPGNMAENRRRRSDNLRRLTMRAIKDQIDIEQSVIPEDKIYDSVIRNWELNAKKAATPAELSQILYDLVQDFDGEHRLNAKNSETYYDFKTFIKRQSLAQAERQVRELDQQELGRVIFSTDAEDAEAEKNASDVEYEAFDKRLGLEASELQKPDDALEIGSIGLKEWGKELKRGIPATRNGKDDDADF